MTLVINSMGGMTFRSDGSFNNFTAPSDPERLDLLMARNAADAVVVLEGGQDINPALYHQPNRYCDWLSRDRDAHETNVYNAAKKHGIPVIGICRGHQLVAALEGGTLYQDIEIELGHGHNNRHLIDFTHVANEIGFVELMQSNPTGRPEIVNSLHHQAVRDVPESAMALAYHVDGTPEALFYPAQKVLTVQWHPEFLGHTQFIAFVLQLFKGDMHVYYIQDHNGGGDRILPPGTRGA